MSIFMYLVMFFIGFIGSFFSGMLGIGGSIINYPLLLYVPDWLNVSHFTAKQVSSISMFQVLFSSLSGVIAYWKVSKKDVSFVHKGLVLYMGGSILIGSLIGGVCSKFLPSESINIVYGVLAVLAVLLMIIPQHKSCDRMQVNEITFNRVLAMVISFVVGIVSGIVGAGGAFILIPIMLTVLKIPMRITIASSLAVVFLSAIGGAFGKLTTGEIPFWATFFAVAGSLLGAPLGSFMSRRMNVKMLRYGLMVLISLTAIKIWY
ncbi:sulfite exporter TauE/SafE family protein, partial [Bacillus smithii]|uniref:sulfite exporter TauE/SafE family protein n=1 Tax=Bacillus smithii TaxID=1479 RepID=UPI003BEEEC00